MNEADFQRQITDLAEILGWSWVHFRPARTQRGWATPVSGPMGKGWPDLFMVRGHRSIAAELKSDKGKATPEQYAVMEILQATSVETFIWRPADFDRIVEILR